MPFGKADCLRKNPVPAGGKSAITTTVVQACGSAKPTTTTKAPIPTPTGICSAQNNPVGGIPLPVVTCNDLASSFASGPFKLYTDSNSSKCPVYGRGSGGNACVDACDAQYNSCVNTYAQGCRDNVPAKSAWDWWGSKRAAGSFFGFAGAVERRTFGWTDTFSQANSKCQVQYNACVSANRPVTGNGKCGSFGAGF
jgi:hypothetical protein